jgi:hypothetical protein
MYFSNSFTFMFDGDSAGEKGIDNLGRKLCRRARVFVAVIPDGEDPDTMDEQDLMGLYEDRQVFHAPKKNFFYKST